MDIVTAINGFGRGFSYTRSNTYPYRFVEEPPVWILEDHPQRPDGRVSEVIVYRTRAAEAEAVIARRITGRRYCVCLVYDRTTKEPPLKAEWKALGYRTRHLETFMVAPLEDVPAFDCGFPVVRVEDQEMADAVNREAGSRQILPEQLRGDDSPLRLYTALDDGVPVGWVRSIPVGEAAWVSNMYVKESHRRRGIGRALLSTLLHDDRRLGMRESVLLASTDGAKLYPQLGYETIGYLRVFTPLAKR